MRKVRQATNTLIELCELGSVSWENLALACLSYMSEDEVRDMGESNDFIGSEDEENEE
jgi:hypothetical protein